MDQYIAGRIVQMQDTCLMQSSRVARKSRQSKAERSYIYSMEIQQHGFDTPEPVAMIEQFQSGLNILPGE